MDTKILIKDFIARITSRKFLFAVVAVLTIIINASGHLSSTDIWQIVVVVLGYFGVNLAETKIVQDTTPVIVNDVPNNIGN